MFKKSSRMLKLNVKKFFPIMLILCLLFIQVLFPCRIYAKSTLRTISGTVTYANGIAPQGGIWITMYAMGENGGCFTTDALIREGDSSTQYLIDVDLENANNSRCFIIRCEPHKLINYSSTYYNELVDVSNSDASNISLWTELLSTRIIYGTITYANGLAPEGGIDIVVSATGGADFEKVVKIPEGCNKINYSIPVDLSITGGNSIFEIQCKPKDETKYIGIRCQQKIDVIENNVPNINCEIVDMPL